MTWRCTQCDHAEALAEPGQPCPEHGGTLVHEAVLERWRDDALLGQVLDQRYALYDILGRGGMGAVYRGRHLRLGRDVAIKTILPGGRETPGFDVRERFFLEARMLANLNSPGVVSLHDYGEDAGRLFMVLELVEGVSLQALLRQLGPLPVDRACRLAVGMLRALEAPHALGLVHRDIKPGNVMVGTAADGHERITLIDFGVAKALETEDESLSGPATRTGLTIGTPRYMAPEQLAHQPVGPASDQYAVGIVLYRMLAGHTPFTGPAAVVVAAHLKDPAPPLPDFVRASAALQAVLARALAKDPSERFESCAAMADVLEAVASTADREPPVALAIAPTPWPDHTEVSEPQTPPWQGEVVDPSLAVAAQGKGRWVLALLMLAAFAGGLGYFLAPSDPTDPVAAAPARVVVAGRQPTAPPSVAPSQAAPVSQAPVSAAPASAAASRAPATRPAPRRRPAAKPKPPRRRVVARRPRPAPTSKAAPARIAPTAASATAAPATAAPPNPRVRFDKLLSRCLCEDARRAIGALPAAERAEARERARARCDIVGLGCNAGQ